jgi:hypothetical protein
LCRSSLGYQHFAPLIPSTLMPLGFAIEDSDVSSFTLSSSAHIASATGREFMLGECRTGPLAAWRFGGRIVGLVDDRSRVDSWDLRTPSCALMAKQRTKPPRSCRAGDCVVCSGASRECTAAAFCALQHRQRICTVDFAIAPFLPQPLDRSPARAGSGSRHACAHLKRGGCAVRFHRQRRETHACQRQQAPHCLRFLAPSLPLVLRCTRFVRTASYIHLVIIFFLMSSCQVCVCGCCRGNSRRSPVRRSASAGVDAATRAC